MSEIYDIDEGKGRYAKDQRSTKCTWESTEQYDRLTNDRSFWSIGFAVEIYSVTDEFWYPGQILKVKKKKSGRKVEVIYNGKTKTLPITSDHLRPLIADAKNSSRMSRDSIYAEATKLLEQHEPTYEAISLDAFISYCKQDAEDAVALLQVLLNTRGVDVWLDAAEADISTRGMSRGIAMSRVFIIYLTKSYFERVFTIFELETARALGKQIIVIWEGEEKHAGYRNIESCIDACPNNYKAELFQNEALRFERRKHLRDAQIAVIAQRIKTQPDNIQRPTPCMKCNVL